MRRAAPGEATLVVIKPDAIRRQLAGAVLSRLEALGLEILGAKALRVTRPFAETHYRHIRHQPFFRETVDFLQGKRHGTSSVLALVFWGHRAVSRVRALAGATHPERADPETIRGSLGRMRTDGLMENILHASSTAREARREIRLWFRQEELLRPIGQPR